MDGEREDRGEDSLCGNTMVLADTHSQIVCAECEESQELPDQTELPETGAAQPSQAEEDDAGLPGDECDGAEQDVCISNTEILPQETPVQDDTLQPPSTPLEGEITHIHTQHSSLDSNTHNRPREPCWYCLRSLPSEERTEPQQESESDPLSPSPPGGQRVSYQTDPRPHFGVACSSRSTPLPLWGSEGPRWELRDQELPDQAHTCSHCHLALPPDTLRWHEAKCLLFDGLKNTD